MYCPHCKATDTKVIDSRILQNGQTVRRRRQCLKCEKRFTTYEQTQLQLPIIVKQDGRREPFNEQKIWSGLRKACQKRPVSTDQIQDLIDLIARKLSNLSTKEVPSDKIGEMIMDELYILDPVAYVRFASFYWDFKNIEGFVEGLQKIIKTQNRKKEDTPDYVR